MRALLIVLAATTMASGQTFTSRVDQVAIPVTIVAPPGESPTDLRAEDFRVFDDGRPVPIVTFGRVTQSLHIVLLLDTSTSMLSSLADVRSAASAIVAQLRMGDSVRVATFSGGLQISPALSHDDSEVAARLNLVPGRNATLLYDALMEGCGDFTADMDRRIMFVVSDGVDTGSTASPQEVMRRAAATNVSMYAVGLPSRSDERGRSVVRAPDTTLRDIAEDSGGSYVYAGARSDLSKIFAGMIGELYQQYLLGFTPAQADGRLHSLVVTTSRANLKTRARKHYLAGSR